MQANRASSQRADIYALVPASGALDFVANTLDAVAKPVARNHFSVFVANANFDSSSGGRGKVQQQLIARENQRFGNHFAAFIRGVQRSESIEPKTVAMQMRR